MEEAVQSLSRGKRASATLPDVRAAQFRTTILPHLDAAYNLARFLSRDADAAQDIVQEAYLRAFRSFESYRGGSSRAWILAIVRNCHHTWFLERRRASMTEPLAGGPGTNADGGAASERREFTDEESSPEKDLLRRSEAREVRSTLEILPEAFREVLVLRELEDLSYREIAEATATPIGTVMSRLSRARKLFQAAWRRRVGEEEAA